MFRSVDRSRNQSSTEDDGSSEDEMDWSGNSLLLTSLSIPQLDGTADETSGKYKYNKYSIMNRSGYFDTRKENKKLVFCGISTIPKLF